MTQEINTRTLFGNGGKVRWTYDGTSHTVTVEDFAGVRLGEVTTLDGLDAYDAFTHPFVRPSIANPFDNRKDQTC